METTDPKYKHKPSEKHTLEEVLKSLQDLIRNDLLDNNQAAAGKSGSAPVPSEEKPPRESTAPVREDFAPVNPAAGPVNLDAVMRSLTDLVSNELNVGNEPAAAEELSPSPTEDHETSNKLADEFVPLDEELTTAEESSPSRTEDHDAPENPVNAFEPLDEDLTFEEPMEVVPPPPAAPATPEIPGEISAEILSEPEAEIARSPPALEIKADIAPGTQHQLLFEEAPLPATATEPSSPDLAPKLEIEPETKTDGIAPEMAQDTATQSPAEVSGDALPTIDVEESFDENAYFEAEAKQAEAASTDTQETQDIILSAIEASLEPETTPPASGEAQLPAEIPAPASEPASGKPKIKLDIAVKPAMENVLSIPSVDFDTVKVELPREEAAPLTPAIETSVSPDEAAPIMTDDRLAQEITLDSGPLEILSLSEETRPGAASEAEGARQGNRVHGPGDGKIPDKETAPPVIGATHATAPVTEPATPETTESIDLDEIPVQRAETKAGDTPETVKAPDTVTTPPATGETHATAPVTKHATPETTESIDLDEIPVLREVVAPPAGSALAGEPALATQPPLPAPDRARDIVVRAVAKLNVEMRKSGGTGLDTKTILRLQQLMRRELEKDGEKS